MWLSLLCGVRQHGFEHLRDELLLGLGQLFHRRNLLLQS